MDQCEDCGYGDRVHMPNCIFNPKPISATADIEPIPIGGTP